MDYWGSDGLQNVSSPYKASWTEQFSAVFWRSWLSIKKEPALTKIRLIQTVVGIKRDNRTFRQNDHYFMCIKIIVFFLFPFYKYQFNTYIYTVGIQLIVGK